MGLSWKGRRGLSVLLASRACRLRRGESNAQCGLRGGEEKMRIADILGEEEDKQCCDHGDAAAVTSSGSVGTKWGMRKKKAYSGSPGCLLSRWLPPKQFLKCRSCGEEYEDEAMEEQEREEEGGDVGGPASLGLTVVADVSTSADKEKEGISNSDAMASSSDGEITPAGSEERRLDGPVLKPEQAYINIGMGAGLLFLLTRNMAEFNKMIELRKETEVMLKEIKDAMQRKDTSPSSSESKNNLTFGGSDSWTGTEQSHDLSARDSDPCLELVDTTCDTEPESCLKFNRVYEETKSQRIDEMEAKLVSELELLQLNLDNQDSPEQLGAELSGERTDLSDRFSLSLGEHSEPKGQAGEEDSRDEYGVCPQELSRRLHELLEARQQERIEELESALEIARIRLREKEMEVRWWRDTAQ